jgi:uncharacterized lipoprotein YajG
MKKLSVHLSLLCLLAFLLIPFAGCKKEETEVEETPATSDATMETTTEPMTSGATSDMGTDMTTSEPTTTDTPPAGQ